MTVCQKHAIRFLGIQNVVSGVSVVIERMCVAEKHEQQETGKQ